jgi:hypothetical protein
MKICHSPAEAGVQLGDAGTSGAPHCDLCLPDWAPAFAGEQGFRQC